MGRPILLIGDDPSASTGLARICRDLATLLASMPEFRVATLGQGGTGSARLPWTQYHMHTRQEFGELSLPDVWEEFSRGEPGIVLAIWDATRLTWLARPEWCEIESTRQWLEQARHKRFQLWAYCPFDAVGPNGRFTEIVKETLLGIDRVLVPTPWARDAVRATIGDEESVRRGLDWLPHGLNLKTFAPLPLSISTSDASDVKRVGVVATNQMRKDWGTIAVTCAILAERLRGKVKFWWHCDLRERHWSLDALIADLALGEYVELSSPPADDSWLASQYRACDVTLAPSAEGFGYPAFESLACGVPCVAGDVAALGSLYRAFGLERLLVAPRAWRLEGVHNCVRPVYEPQDFAIAIERVLSDKESSWQEHVSHLSWMKLGHTWKRWFKEGL